MTTITADLFQALNHLTDTELPNANAEYILQQAIDRLNTYGAGIPDLSGTTPNKSISATSAQAGAILEAAWLVYWAYYKGQETVQVSGLSTSSPNMLNNSVVEEKIKQLAGQLKTRSFLRT